MPDHSLFRLRILPWCIALAMSGSYSSVWAEDDIQFDSRFLELKGDTKIDLKRFSSQGYVEPGKYNLQVQLNKQPLAEEYDIYWYAGEDDVSKSYACLTPELVAQFGLKEDVAKNLQWSHDGKCLKPGQLEGVEIKADLSQSALVISLPQAYLEYTWPDWDPPSRWDDGISGIIADYSITAQTRHEENGGDDSNEISGNGTVGVNLGPWRMRADWQTNYQHTRSNDDDDEFGGDDTQKKWEWSRYYAWRALPSLKAKLALGEDYLNSDIFDGFNYVGGSVSTDDQMLPPNLRGYAPDISGVAHTTAKVTVSQMGRVIYETEDVSVDEVLDELLPDLMDIYEGKKIHLVRIKGEEPFVIRCNLSLTQILVSNLVKNSLVHNHAGGELYIETTPSSLIIKNSGEHPLDGEKLFRRFYRSIDGKKDSTGLGLAIARSIAISASLSLTYKWQEGMHLFLLVKESEKKS